MRCCRHAVSHGAALFGCNARVVRMQGPWAEEGHNELLSRKDMNLLCSLQERVTKFSRFISVTERSDLHVHSYTHTYTHMHADTRM